MIITCTLCSERKGSNKFCSSQKKAADSVCRACGKSTEVSTLYIAIDEQGKGDIHLFRDEQDATTYCSTIGALVQETKAFPSLMATRMGDPLQKVQVSGENPRKVYMVCLYDFRGCIADILTTTHREDTAKQFLKCFKLNGAGAFEAKNTYIRTAIVEDKLDNPNIATSRCHLSYSNPDVPEPEPWSAMLWLLHKKRQHTTAANAGSMPDSAEVVRIAAAVNFVLTTLLYSV